MKDTMQPTKPEDYETAIPIDKKALRKEVEYILNYSKDSPLDPFSDLKKHDEEPEWMINNLNKPKEKPTNIKCTCPLKLSTKKRNKKKNIITISRAANGYTVRCPVHHRI